MFSTTSIRSMVTATAVFPVVSATVSLRMMTAHRNHIRKLSLQEMLHCQVSFSANTCL